MLDAYSPLSGAQGAFRKHVMYGLFCTALKKHTGHHPGLVSDNGVQFKSQDNLKRNYEDNEEEQLGVLPLNCQAETSLFFDKTIRYSVVVKLRILRCFS